MNTNNTNATSGTGTGSGMGNRVRGVAEVVHGAGENLRGTLLAAVDTVVKKGPTQNDEIARQGRLEMERGMGHLRGNTGGGSTSGTGMTATGKPSTTSPQTLNARNLDSAPYSGAQPSHTGAGVASNQPTGAYDSSTNTNIGRAQPGLGPGSELGGAQMDNTGYPDISTRDGQDPTNFDRTRGHEATATKSGAQYPLGVGAAPYGSGAQGPGGFKGDHAAHTYDSEASERDAASAAAGGTVNATHPGHHREDAIAGVPAGELHDVQTLASQSGPHQLPGQNTGAGNFNPQLSSVPDTQGSHKTNFDNPTAPGSVPDYVNTPPSHPVN